jgi:hypothetical protein
MLVLKGFCVNYRKADGGCVKAWMVFRFTDYWIISLIFIEYRLPWSRHKAITTSLKSLIQSQWSFSVTASSSPSPDFHRCIP